MIKNMADLENTVNKYLIKALELTRKEIYMVMADKIVEYYTENVFSEPDSSTPEYYERTFKLINSLKYSDITKGSNGFEFWCGWDDEYLSFRYDGGFTTKKYGSKYDGITGLQVLQALDKATHGYTVQGKHKYWQEILQELGHENGILQKFKDNCKKVGLPIK